MTGCSTLTLPYVQHMAREWRDIFNDKATVKNRTKPEAKKPLKTNAKNAGIIVSTVLMQAKTMNSEECYSCFFIKLLNSHRFHFHKSQEEFCR